MESSFAILLFFMLYLDFVTFQQCIDGWLLSTEPFVENHRMLCSTLREYVVTEKARELNCSDSIWNGSLLHLCYSARKKLHIGIRLPVGMTIEETQKAYCEALGVPYDESCITPERMIYLTDKDSEIYRSKMWCAVLSEKEILMRRQAYLDRGLTVDGRGDAKVNRVFIVPS